MAEAETVSKRAEVDEARRFEEEQESNEDQQTEDSGPDQSTDTSKEEASGSQKKKRQNSARWKRWWLKNREKYNERRRLSAQARSAKARARMVEPTDSPDVPHPRASLPASKKLKATVSGEVVTPPVISWNSELKPTMSPGHSMPLPPPSSYLPFLPLTSSLPTGGVHNPQSHIASLSMMPFHPQMAATQASSGVMMPNLVLMSHPPSPTPPYPTHLMAPLPLSVFQPIGLMPPSVNEGALKMMLPPAPGWAGRPFVGSGAW